MVPSFFKTEEHVFSSFLDLETSSFLDPFPGSDASIVTVLDGICSFSDGYLLLLRMTKSFLVISPGVSFLSMIGVDSSLI